MAVFAADSEPGAPFDVLLLGSGRVDIVDSNVEQVHSSTVLTIISPYVGHSPGRFHYDGHSVQGGVAGVEDVSRHWLYHRAAEFIERAGQIGSDCLRRAPLDLMAMHKMHDFSIAEQRH